MQSNVLILTYWSYDDSLVQGYTLPYVRIIKKNLPEGSKIILLTLERERSETKDDKIKSALSTEGIEWIGGSYRPFGFGAILMWVGLIVRLITCIFKKNVRTIHCWGTPVGSIGYLLSVLTNRPLVIDSYEPHAEAMIENGTWEPNSTAFKILFLFEKWQTRRATHLIAANGGMKEYAKNKYHVDLDHILVKPACVDLNKFSKGNCKNVALLAELGLTDKIVCVYAGKFGGIYLEREIFDFLFEAHAYWGDRFRIMLLTNHSSEEIKKYCALSGLDPSIIAMKFVPHRDVPDYLGLGDFAVTPVKPVPTKRYCTPIKDGEYWALGLPVVIPTEISDDSEIIEKNNAGALLQRFDKAEYLLAVKKIDRLLGEDRAELFSRINALAIQYRSFEIAERIYKNVYGKGFK